ncbi:hypothetical protein LCGC14_0303870 [marine sediment metagenome]|uniref:Amidohydrolase-related domain-containing protein n=1 Tax=marine sediment metagenome TaxID=412755 RepID=A0A0F9U6M3_9ZZZZ|nr:amidohydrolase [Phycisphaerae bacterium]HDZ42795.1 amidohydrolase [Phycisphaerae bacterium]
MAKKTIDPPIALTNAKIETVTKGTIARGTIVIRSGKIAAVGKSAVVPKGARTINCRGRLVTPGLIDAHSHAGLMEDGFPGDGDTNETSDPITPHMLALDAFKPSDVALTEAALAGVTTIFVTPGSGNLMGGIGAVLKTHAPSLNDQIVVAEAGMKMAMGENPKRVYGHKGAPKTRMAIAAILRKTFADAVAYDKKRRIHAKSKKAAKEPFAADPKLEAVCRVLNGKLPARCHAHRAVDMLTFMRIADKYKFTYCFEHATEAHDILDELVKRKIPVVIGPTMHSRMKVELKHRTFATIPRCVDAGLTVAVTTDHSVLPMERLVVIAALAMREGLSRDDAMKVMTINPAKILGLDKRLGSIERGKDADLVVWPGDPLDIRTKPTDVFIAGRRLDVDPPYIP